MRREILVLGRFLGLLCAFHLQAVDQATAQEPQHTAVVRADLSLKCIHRILGKPALMQSAVDLRWLIEPCPESQEALRMVLNRDGLRLFDAGEFSLVIPSKFFPPLPADYDAHWPQVKWTNIKITAQVRPAEGMAQNEADQIGRKILDNARLIPLIIGFNQIGTTSSHLNIYLYEVHLEPNGPTSIIAWINQLPEGSVGRFVYGELQDDKYSIRWDSPLFSDKGNVSFADVNGDGRAEIMMQSRSCGNGCNDLLFIFDKNGHELTRSPDNTSCFTVDEGWACGVEGDEVSVMNVAEGPKQIQVKGAADGKDHTFRLVAGAYAPFPPFIKESEVERTAAAFNDNGMQLMKQGDLEQAALAFRHAAEAATSKNPKAALLANNAGFAYYKLGKYEDAVTWLRKAIEIDPKRAVAYLNLGDALAKLKRNADARDAYKTYVELAPDSKATTDVKKKLEALPPAP